MSNPKNYVMTGASVKKLDPTWANDSGFCCHVCGKTDDLALIKQRHDMNETSFTAYLTADPAKIGIGARVRVDIANPTNKMDELFKDMFNGKTGTITDEIIPGSHAAMLCGKNRWEVTFDDPYIDAHGSIDEAGFNEEQLIVLEEPKMWI